MAAQTSSPRPFSVGLTGGIGSGKSTVADMFAAHGAAVIDTDLIAHQLTSAGGAAVPAIQAQFGPAFLTAEGAMDRAKMRALVFGKPGARAQLEAILHPLIRIETARAAREAQGAYLMFVVPLLVESSGWRERVNRILVVDCPENLQERRVIMRNGLAAEQVRAMMAAQASRAQRLAVADDVISNDSDTLALAPQVDRLHAFYSAEAARPG